MRGRNIVQKMKRPEPSGHAGEKPDYHYILVDFAWLAGAYWSTCQARVARFSSGSLHEST
jgi:hypothetical protein